MNVVSFLPVKPSKGLTDFGPTKCQTHLAKMTDINTMIARAVSGDTSVYRKGSYFDASIAPDEMQDVLNAQRAAIEAYDNLPASVRSRWASPEAFLAAANDPEQMKEFVKLGLAFEKTPEGPIEVKVINSVTPKGAESSTGSACA